MARIKSDLPVIYVSHAYSSDPAGHSNRIRLLCRALSLQGVLALAPQLLLPQFLEEATEREFAVRCCLRLVALADEIRVYGEPTAGMRIEIAEAQRLGIPVVDGVTGAALIAKGEPPR